jgi:AcrR family transcriptional regulator
MKIANRPYDMRVRTAKAKDTADQIRRSAATLYSERSLDDFTLDEVASRANTTVQTVLRIFKSKSHLIIEALCDLSLQGTPVIESEPGDVVAAVGAIFDLYETIGDALIQRLADELRLSALKPAMDVGRDGHRRWVKTVFAPQLRQYNGVEKKQVFNALVAATDVYVWKLLRRDQALARAAAEAVIRRIIIGITNQE